VACELSSDDHHCHEVTTYETTVTWLIDCNILLQCTCCSDIVRRCVAHTIVTGVLNGDATNLQLLSVTTSSAVPHRHRIAGKPAVGTNPKAQAHAAVGAMEVDKHVTLDNEAFCHRDGVGHVWRVAGASGVDGGVGLKCHRGFLRKEMAAAAEHTHCLSRVYIKD
jgi:hypothetical protein